MGVTGCCAVAKMLILVHDLHGLVILAIDLMVRPWMENASKASQIGIFKSSALSLFFRLILSSDHSHVLIDYHIK